MTTLVPSGGRRWRGEFALLLMLGLLPGTAAAVAVDIANTYSATVGDVIDVEMTADDLTGLGVTSYEFNLTWSENRLSLVDVIEAGTLTSSWGNATYLATPGACYVAGAGSSTLSGSGTLLILRFELGPWTGGTAVNFGEFLLNEGTPSTATDGGYVNVIAAPAISVSPDSGEVAAGDSLAFSVSGSVTPPVMWGTTNGFVAAIDAAGMLTGLSVGSTRVWVEDAAAVRDTTDGVIHVRAMAVSIPGGLSGAPGDLVIVPVEVTDLTGLDTRSFELELTYDPGDLVFSTSEAVGTMTAGWLGSAFAAEPGRVRIAGVSNTPLAGSGTLVFIHFTVPIDASGSGGLGLEGGLFDERYVPIMTGSSFAVVVPPTIWITPDVADVVVGDTQPFTVNGSPTPPFAWGTTDPAIATIDAAGVLTPVAGGNCRVYVEDAAGASDTTSAISVFDLRVTAGPGTVPLAGVLPIPVSVDRDVSLLGISGYELTLTFDSARVNAIAVTDSGGLGATWGPPTARIWSGGARIAHAGGTPLAGGPGPLLHIYFEAAGGAVNGQTSFLSIDLELNEGNPIPILENGVLTITDIVTSAFGLDGSPALYLSPNRPNPFARNTTIQFSLDRRSWPELELTVFDTAGRIVRRWDFGGAESGPHAVRWDGRDVAGLRVGSGVYFARLEGGGHTESRKMVRLR